MAQPTAPAKRAARGPISLKITLKNVKPPVWRRILVPGSMTLGDLHVAIQVVMGWQNSHMHVFDVAGERYGERGTLEDSADEDRLTLNGLIRLGASRFRYTYDFGDDWEHDILIEKALPATRPTALPACVAGKRKCPPEDCGGPWGYEDLLEVFRNPEHPDAGETREWIGENFDPEAFSVAATDTALGEVFRRKAG